MHKYLSNMQLFLNYAFVYTKNFFLCIPAIQIVHIFYPRGLHTLEIKTCKYIKIRTLVIRH